MYRKVLIPLDGSELAECALPHIKSLAKGGGAGEVILLRTVETQLPFAYTGADDFAIGQSYDFEALWDEEFARSQNYLADVQGRLKTEGIVIRTEAVKGLKAAEVIVDYAHKNGIDLIIMSTHGYTGMKKLMLGSVAFRVLHESHVPVLLIRPESCRS